MQCVIVQEDGEYVPQFYEIPSFCDMTAKISALTELKKEIAENAEEARAEVLEAEAEAREAQEEAKEAQLEAEEMKSEEDKAFKKLKLQLLEKKWLYLYLHKIFNRDKSNDDTKCFREEYTLKYKMGNMLFNRRLGTAEEPDSELGKY